MPLAADVSNNNQRFLEDNEADLQHLLGIGVERFQVGLQYPSRLYLPGNAHLILPAVLRHHDTAEVYAESQFIGDVWANVAPWQSRIRRAWQTAEESIVDADWLRRSFAFMDGLGLAQRPGRYTGAWWWSWRDTTLVEFDDRDSWVADYNGLPTLEIWPFTGSGHVVLHQYWPDYVLPSGDKCDLSWYDPEPAPVVVDTPSPSISERASLEAQYVFGRGSLVIPGLVRPTGQDWDLFVEGQLKHIIPAGTLAKEYRLLVPVNPPPGLVGA